MTAVPSHALVDPGIVVVGAINVDLVVSAASLPKPGETVVGSGPFEHPGGKGANAALAAARAGTRVTLIGAVGHDRMADVALKDLRDVGVDVSGVAVHASVSTGVALIVVDQSGENQIAVGAGANAEVRPDWVTARMSDVLRAGIGCVLVSTEIPGDAVAAAVRAARAAGVPCVLNTAPPNPAVLKLLDHGPIMTPNARELDILMGLLPNPNPLADGASLTVSDQALNIARRTGRPVVVTLGAAGALTAEPAGSITRVRPPSTEVVDTTGAGDTFNGLLASRIAAGDGITQAVGVAVAAASISVSRSGARGGMPDQAALAAFIAKISAECPRIISRQPLSD